MVFDREEGYSGAVAVSAESLPPGVEALAGEVGIAREMVRAAALEVTPSAVPRLPAEVRGNNPWISGPTSILFERVIAGELPDAEWPALVDAIRRSVRNAGQVSQFGRSFSWVATRRGASQRDLEIAVSVRGGETRITVQENLSTLIGAVFGGIGGGMGGGGLGPIIGITMEALHLPGPALLMIIPLWLATTFSTARAVYRYNSRKRMRELEALADRLAALTGDLVGERPKLGSPERRLTP